MKIYINNLHYEPIFSTFPGGEEYVRLPSVIPQTAETITIATLVNTSQKLVQLLMITDALRRHYQDSSSTTYTLSLGYLPYARQDRVCAEGESLSIKVLTDIINGMKFDSVLINDAHSEVSLALLDNAKHTDQYHCIAQYSAAHNMIMSAEVIVAPDAGASKKSAIIAEKYGKPLVQCLKTRSSDGKIEVQVLGDVANKRAVIVDDICDGGGTFMALATELRKQNVGWLGLYVTHGIFSKGTETLESVYDMVTAYATW